MKIFTPQIAQAINIAATHHDGQERKGDGLPYIIHPIAVAMILMDYTQDQDVLVASILHDVLEDTSYTKEQMEEDFGPKVTGYVWDVTEREKDLPWQERKDAYLAQVRDACFESKLICAADKIHNLISMSAAFLKFGDGAYEKFNAPMDKKLWFYEECLKVCRDEKKMPEGIVEEFEEVMGELVGGGDLI